MRKFLAISVVLMMMLGISSAALAADPVVTTPPAGPVSTPPQITLYETRINENTGYPQIVVGMKSETPLSNICFVRHFTDENGNEASEIFDIITLQNSKEPVIFRTLDLPGAYTLQVNDTSDPVVRTNTRVVMTLIDTDGNGVADAYCMGEDGEQIALDVEGGITPVEPEATEEPVAVEPDTTEEPAKEPVEGAVEDVQEEPVPDDAADETAPEAIG